MNDNAKLLEESKVVNFDKMFHWKSKRKEEQNIRRKEKEYEIKFKCKQWEEELELRRKEREEDKDSSGNKDYMILKCHKISCPLLLSISPRSPSKMHKINMGE